MAFCEGPLEPIAPPKTRGSGSSEYNGEADYPKRTSTPNGVDEVSRDGAMPPAAPNKISTDGPLEPVKGS